MPNDEDTLAHPEQPRFLLSAWLWAVTLFVFFGVIAVIAFGAMSRGSTYEGDRAKTRGEKLKTAEDEWNKTAGSYGWVDKGKGVAHIPIERAVVLELADLRQRKPMPAGPIATPAPVASPEAGQQPANSPAPAASAAPTASAVEGLKPEVHGKPAAATNPPNAGPGPQPGANATPAAAPKTQSDVAPVSPANPPVSKPTGTPMPPGGGQP